MFRIFVAAGAAAVGAALAVAPIASASPDDQFMHEVQYYVAQCPNTNSKGNCILPNALGALISSAHSACFFLNEGRNSSEAMGLVAQGRRSPVRDPIGFMLASTRAYCPQHTYMYSGL
jgi:hypothetical protein